jgi:SAM-dependent methyltransferase
MKGSLLLRFLPLRKFSGYAISIQRSGAPFRTSSSTSSLMPVPPPDSDDDDAFTKLEYTNWQRGVDAYHAGFGPLTSQAVPTLLDKVGFLVLSSFLDDQNQKKVIEEESLLDVACGPGQVITAAVSKAKKMSESKRCCCSYTVTGLDFSCNFIQLAKKNLKLDHPDTTSSSSSNIINFVEGDAQYMSPQFEDESFTAVTSNFGILHLSKPDLFLKESYRVLKPGGKLAFSAWLAPPDTEGFDLLLSVVNDVGNPYVTMPDGPPFFRFSDPEEIQHSLKEAGFIDIDITSVKSMEWTNVNSSDQLYNILLEGTARTRELLRGQTKEETKAIQEELQRRYDAKCSITTVTTGGTARSQRHLCMPAVISSGRKPL